MVYQRVSKPSSENSQIHKKDSASTAPAIPIQAKSDSASPQEQEMPSYTPLVANWATNNNLMRSMSGAQVVQRQEESGKEEMEPIQAKLTIGQVGDKYEQEADQTAQRVVNQINTPAPQQSAQGQSLQREAMSEEDELQMKPESGIIQREDMPQEELQMKSESSILQREDMPEDELQMKPESGILQREDMPEDELQMKSAVQRKSDSGGMAATPDLEASIQQAKGGGQPLADNIREPMEQAFGADFSGVNIHTDAQSDQLNQSIQAKAFTTGQDVFFRQGAYDPGSRGGQELIAHELTHVVQQTGAVQRQTQLDTNVPVLQRRLRSNAVSQNVGTGAARLGSLAQVRQTSPGDLDLEEAPSTKSEAEETADETVESLSSVTEATSDLLGDEALGNATAATGGNYVSAVGGILGLYQAIQQVRGEDINERIEGIFGLVGGVSSGVETGAEIAKTVVTEGSNSAVGAEMAAAIGGTVGEGIEAVKGLVLTIKGVYDAYKNATSEEGSSTKEKVETGLSTVRGLVEAAGKAVSAGKTIVDMLQQASGGLAQAVPGLSIALSAVNIAIEVFNIIKAKTSEKFVKSVLASNYWEKANVFGEGKKRRQQQSEYAKTYTEEIQKMKLKLATLTDPQQIAELRSLIQLAEKQQAALLENLSLSNLAETNSDRTANAGFSIGVEMTKVVGDVLSLVPEPNSQVTGMSLKAAAAGASISKSIFTKGRQFLRNKAESKPDSFLNKIVDTTQSTTAKTFRRKETAKYIFSQIAALPEPNSPEFLVQKDRIEQLIEATGISPNALYRSARSSGLDEAIKLLVKAQGE